MCVGDRETGQIGCKIFTSGFRAYLSVLAEVQYEDTCLSRGCRAGNMWVDLVVCSTRQLLRVELTG